MFNAGHTWPSCTRCGNPPRPTCAWRARSCSDLRLNLQRQSVAALRTGSILDVVLRHESSSVAEVWFRAVAGAFLISICFLVSFIAADASMSRRPTSLQSICSNCWSFTGVATRSPTTRNGSKNLVACTMTARSRSTNPNWLASLASCGKSEHRCSSEWEARGARRPRPFNADLGESA